MEFLNNTITEQERIIVALDCSHDEAIQLAKALQGVASWVKVGMTLYYEAGPRIVSELRELGFKVFLDLKLYDIPHQVQGAVMRLANCGANMLTLHASGGAAMMLAAREGAQRACAQTGNVAPALLGVTVLTSFDDAGLREIGIERCGAKQVELLGNVVFQAGLDGIVCSAHEARSLRAILGADKLIVTPGIRLAGPHDDDQRRVATPSFAFLEGASHLVIGRPITQAPQPVEAFWNMLKE